MLPRFRSVLVGRDVELDNFRKLSQRHLRSPSTGFVAISGVSGIGKTSLMKRFETIAKISTAKTYTVSHHRGAGILEAFTQLFNRIAGESEAPIARATKHPTGFAEDFLQLLTQVSNGQPVVLCVNDLQWMDEGSLAIYKSILESAELPIMVIGNYRVDELPGHWEQLESELSRRQLLTEIRIRALQEEEVRCLVSNLLGDTPSEELYKKVLSQCAGNPFYIYEFLRFLQETGELSFRSGHWPWQPTERMSTVPGTVVENMRARLQGIDSVSSQLLESLSVLERPIPLDWLAQILKMQVSHLEERLNFLERLDFVSISGTLQKPVVLLSHDWLGRVIRGNLAAKERKALHRRIALFFETECSKEEHSLSREALVRHFLGAGDGLKVRKHIWRAIEWLEKSHLYKEAGRVSREGTALLTCPHERVHPLS